MPERTIDIDLIREASRDESQARLEPEGPAAILLKRIYALMGPALGESTAAHPELVVRVPGDGGVDYRSAESGRYVTAAEAAANPSTTVKEQP